MSRKRKNRFDVPAARRSEIERDARTIEVAMTDDFHTFLIAWQWHNVVNIKDPAGALMEAAQRMGGNITEEEANQIIEEAAATPPIRDADALGAFLGLTDEMRTKLDIRTIGSTDVSSRQRARRRKNRKRVREQSRRRANGAKSRTEYLTTVAGPRPWEAEGISRRTWYRRRAAAATEPHHRQRLPNTGEQTAMSVVTETPCPQETVALGQPFLGTGSVSMEKRRGNGHEPSAMGEGGNGHEPRVTGNGHDAAPDPEPLCACCGEPGNTLRDPLMRDRHGRLIHRRCRDESDWSVPQGRSLHWVEACS
jgi:hypothetical protein